jgi:flagellar basal-body rod modification protein FlgD
MIPGVTPVLGNSAANSTEPIGNQALGKDDFLKLLIAQLAAQDPLDPMGAQDFSAQLAQFSGLEQMTNVNKNLEKMYELDTNTQHTSAIQLIGKTIESSGNSFSHSAGTSEVLAYSLSSDAETVSVEIYDSENNRVDRVNLTDQGKGKNTASWDGFDFMGNSLPAGPYSFNITARDFDGKIVQATTFSSGLVSDVVFGEDETYAIVNGKELPINAIKRVSINQ